MDRHHLIRLRKDIPFVVVGFSRPLDDWLAFYRYLEALVGLEEEDILTVVFLGTGTVYAIGHFQDGVIWLHTTRILQFVLLSCKLGSLLFNSHWNYKVFWGGPGDYLFNAFFSHPSFISSAKGLQNKEPNFNRIVQKCKTMSPTLSHLSELVKSFINNITDRLGTVIELFYSLRFSVKHWGSVSATARQQKYCASNPRADPRLMDKSAEGIEAIHDAWLVLSVLVQL